MEYTQKHTYTHIGPIDDNNLTNLIYRINPLKLKKNHHLTSIAILTKLQVLHFTYLWLYL